MTRRLPEATPLHLTDEGVGPVIVLLHGQPGTLREMVPIEQALGDSVRVLNVDRPGYGGTGGRATPFAEQADQLAAELQRRQATPAVLVAHSMAGGIALTLALRHPEVVAGLVLLASIGGAGSVTFGDAVLAAPMLGPAASALTLLGFGQLLPRVARHLHSPAIRANSLDHPATVPLREVQAFIDEQRFLMRDHEELTARLARVECPSVVVIGGSDLVVAPAAGHDLAERLGAEVLELPELGHLLPRDAPEAVAHAIERLLDRIGAIG